jgi:hypothetical protein
MSSKRNKAKIHAFIDKYLAAAGSTSINNGLQKAL